MYLRLMKFCSVMTRCCWEDENIEYSNNYQNDKESSTIVELELKASDYGPDDLPEQLPVKISVLRQMPGPDTPNYWLAKCASPIHWKKQDLDINYLIVGCRFVGAEMKKGIGNIALNIAYVIDESIINDTVTQLEKCVYVAVCIAIETE